MVKLKWKINLTKRSKKIKTTIKGMKIKLKKITYHKLGLKKTIKNKSRFYKKIENKNKKSKK
jgi:hypothetical protein